MWCRRAAVFLAVCAAGLGAGVASPVWGGLTLVSQSVRADARDREVFFDLTFNHPPNFVTTDVLGRPAEAFQYEIDPASADITQSSFLNIQSIIRGSEIGSGSLLPIRDGFQASTDPSPAAGGWGPIRDKVPFILNGSRLTFAAPFDDLHSLNGYFAYRVFTTNFGTTSDETTSRSISLPPAVQAGTAMLAAIGIAALINRRRARRSRAYRPAS
ncbi:MAG: proteinsorting domain [Phycisphaerales bacterium]|nr:proteinsorting domain [Phycisphaerales bacterium]MDB5358081.1 proteinsorting domain [Phycisphaerales bacterium]